MPHQVVPTIFRQPVFKRYLNQGFTIVELLIVIVVIAILAALVISSYNGVQIKARNTKTVAAVEAWAKAIHLYHADTDNWPVFWSCLGDTTTYDGNGQCWNATTWTVQTSFLTAMRSYLGGSFPQPDTTDIDPSNSPKRGALYYPHTTLGPVIYFTQAGVNSCPKIGGLTNYSTTQLSGGVYCIAQLSP